MARVKVVFFVPINDNDDRPLDAELDALELKLTIQFVGWTSQGFVVGNYRMADGSLSRDVNASYFVVFDESRIEELVEILQAFKKQTLQEAIYLEIHRNVEIRFIT